MTKEQIIATIATRLSDRIDHELAIRDRERSGTDYEGIKRLVELQMSYLYVTERT